MLRLIALPAMLAFAVALAACGGSEEIAIEPTAAAISEPTGTPRPRATFAPRPLQALLEGEGSDVLGPYEMVSGVIIAFVRYDGDAPFSLTFLSEGQAPVTSVDAGPGPYNGERVHSVFEGNDGGLGPGEYTVAVDAAGPWRVRLFQERAIRGTPPEIVLTGSGDGGGSWLQLEDGEYTMSTSHTGSAGFTVDLFDAQGVPPYRIVQATGDHDGEQLFTVGGGQPGENPQPGVYAMGVRSQGDWSVTITDNDAP